MKDEKSLIDLAEGCEKRAQAVQSAADGAQLRQIAAQLKEMAARELASTPVG
jgi:hypothetical protein